MAWPSGALTTCVPLPDSSVQLDGGVLVGRAAAGDAEGLAGEYEAGAAGEEDVAAAGDLRGDQAEGAALVRG